MKGFLTTFTGLFQSHPTGAPAIRSIEIPLIQRDYAQGRSGPSVEEIRLSFLEVLLNAIAGGEPVGLDFVYGKVDHGTLHPLDGQQRLTTLFLLHWYLASTANRLDPDAGWTKFSYATRPSARTFCQELVANPLPDEAKIPSVWIKDQEWYLYVWINDPTVHAMLVMLDAIRSEARRLHPNLDVHAAWLRLTDADSPAVSFYLLPLDDMDSDEALYIKMNSRGKPLTPFENFKALFERDIKHSDRAEDFAHKIDGAWSDLVWPFHGGDNIVDDEFMRYIDFITEICEWREGWLVTERRLGPRARAVFGHENPQAPAHLEFLFQAFDRWRDAEHIRSTFDSIFSTALPGGESYDSRKVVLFGASSTNLFEACCHSFGNQRGGNRAFTLQQSLLLYAVLLHLVHNTDDVARRLRILRNLMAASEDEVRRPNMPKLLKDVEQVIIIGDPNGVANFSTNQVEDERLKQQFLEEHPELGDALFRLEDHPILRGTLSAFDFDVATFRQRAAAFELAFADPAQWLTLTAALLATGDYQRRRPKSQGWQFGTSSRNNETVWRYLLTDAPRDNLTETMTVLGGFLDGLAASDGPLDAYLDALTSNWLEARLRDREFDWRYYVVKYPSMREGDSGIYFGLDGRLGYSMCMLRKTLLRSFYRDPILLAIWRLSGVGDKVDDPWFTGYETGPRWLRLARSGCGLRSIADGIALQPPATQEYTPQFQTLCDQRNDIMSADDEFMLVLPTLPRDGEAIDSEDRVETGAALLRSLADAGL